MAVRATGSVTITTAHGMVQGIPAKDCHVVHRADGYRYHQTGEAALPPQAYTLGSPRRVVDEERLVMALEGYTLATINEFIGRELGISDWITVDQERINEFADCTGDHQWIHVDVERAQRESPFGTTIAHGYLTLALLPAMHSSVGTLPNGVKAALNYGADKVRFINPVKAGARIRDRIMLVGAEEKGSGRILMTTRHIVEIEDEDKPALVADTLALLMA